MFACTAISMAMLLSGVAVPTSIGIEASVLLAIVIGWIVLVETYAKTRLEWSQRPQQTAHTLHGGSREPSCEQVESACGRLRC